MKRFFVFTTLFLFFMAFADGKDEKVEVKPKVLPKKYIYTIEE